MIYEAILSDRIIFPPSPPKKKMAEDFAAPSPNIIKVICDQFDKARLCEYLKSTAG